MQPAMRATTVSLRMWQPLRQPMRRVQLQAVAQRPFCAAAVARTPVTVYTEDEQSIREMVTRFNAVSAALRGRVRPTTAQHACALSLGERSEFWRTCCHQRRSCHR